jgi:hypothetical protein
MITSELPVTMVCSNSGLTRLKTMKRSSNPNLTKKARVRIRKNTTVHVMTMKIENKTITAEITEAGIGSTGIRRTSEFRLSGAICREIIALKTLCYDRVELLLGLANRPNSEWKALANDGRCMKRWKVQNVMLSSKVWTG